MKWSTRMCVTATLAAGATGALAQEPVTTLQDLIGVRGRDGEAQLERRGYTHVRTEKTEVDSYTYWREQDTKRCVSVRTTDGRYASVVYTPESDCIAARQITATDTSGGGAASRSFDRKDAFDTVCGVIVAGKNYRYRCKAEDFYKGPKKVETALYYPDQTIRLVWQAGNQVELRFEGMVPQHARFATSEGETNFQFEDKTYLYISDKDAARLEVQHFQD